MGLLQQPENLILQEKNCSNTFKNVQLRLYQYNIILNMITKSKKIIIRSELCFQLFK